MFVHSEESFRLLAPFFDEDYQKKQVHRLAALPKPLKQVGRFLCGAEKNSEAFDYEQHQAKQRAAFEALVRLPEPDRQRLFAALAPAIAGEMEAAWQVFDRLPYQMGYTRRPFRLEGGPRPPEAMLVRCAWVQRLLSAIQGYEQPVTWFASWAAYLGWTAPDALGQLFAGAIDRGGPVGQEVFEILAATARGDHPTARMGRHVVRGLLCASSPDGWQVITGLLLAAQREEGLRQVIMEAADEAHPEAFRRLLQVVIDENLVRFSAVVRAAAVWAGLTFESASPKAVLDALARLQHMLADPSARQAALQSSDPQELYLALWSLAYTDAAGAVAAAQPLLQHPHASHRFAVVYLLSQMQLGVSEQLLLPLFDDADLRVAITAYNGSAARGLYGGWAADPDLFERLERLFAHLPEQKMALQPIVWDWMTITVDRKPLADALVKVLGTRPPLRLLPYLKSMNAASRLAAAQLFLQQVHADPRYRQALFELAADRDSYVHETVLARLAQLQPRPEEIAQLEALLTRKTGSLRRGVISLLLRQPDVDLLASIDRLLGQKNAQQRLAGIELLREMAHSGRRRPECQERATRLQEQGLAENEQPILADLFTGDQITYTLADALGLANLDKRSRPLEPRSQNAWFGLVKNVRLGSAAAAACISALDALVESHRTEPIELNNWSEGTHTELLGNARWGLIFPDPALPVEDNRQRFQLSEVWEQWWQERPKAQRDEDGFELVRAQAALGLLTDFRSPIGEWTQAVPKELRTYLDEPYDFRPQYRPVVAWVLAWLAYLHPAPETGTFLLHAVEETCHRISKHLGSTLPGFLQERWEIHPSLIGYIQLARSHRALHRADWDANRQARFWGLILWLEQVVWEKGGQHRPEIEDVLQAYQAGAAGEDDLYYYLLGREENESKNESSNPTEIYYSRQRFNDLRLYSGKHPHPTFKTYPFLPAVIERCRERILGVELKRGDLPTAASAPALQIRSVPGASNLVRLLGALGKTEIARSGYFYNLERASVLSHLIRVAYPLETDTPQGFTALVAAARIPERRLVDLAVYAPQWAYFVERALGWQGMAEGVWWVYAHTKDRQWSVESDIRESWAAQISEYTPLTADALMDGAVDVAWFHRVSTVLGEERWQAIYQAARYAASGTGHARARLFADAMLGKLSAGELIERVQAKRNQDAVRALGLVPLTDSSARQAEILRRYAVMQEFLRTGKQFGSQRQASEKLAAAIGLENLSRTAGYADPLRLEWAMETSAIADLASGPVSAQAEGVTVTLSINDLGEPGLAFRRGERELKSLPPSARKQEPVAALVARKQALEQQARRMRASLEAAMVRGDGFSAADIQALFAHPILRVMLEQLIFVGPAGMGYPVEGGRALDGLGLMLPLQAGDALRIAHPYDLLQSGCWHQWQHECFRRERIQPFKQVYRELYVLTETEQDEKNFSRRYAGLQVNPRQALALFGARGWVSSPEEGVSKTFHSEGIVARVGFLQAYFTPAEVEGLTIEAVGFTRRGDWQTIPLAQVPPRLFSEAMRDLDLVVSVAHAGGVDPEASASTVESRAALAEETCQLLSLGNVRVEKRHILVDGRLGNYTIHLGSGVVHKQPGGALCIIPVHGQHRGRLFLPFVDQDPKTAEIISKMLLLARDQEIKDPTILEQILQ